MSLSKRLLAPLLLTLLTIAEAHAQQARLTPVPQAGPVTGWNKLCSQPQTGTACVITQEMFTEQGRFIGSVAMQVVTGPQNQRRLVVNVPLGMWIEDGIQLRVDNGQILRTHFGTCLANGCFGAFDVTDALLNQMRRGRILQVIVRPPEPQLFQINMPLENFGTVYDGNPAEPAEVQARLQAFYADMQRRAAAQPRPQAPGQPAPATPRQ